MSTPKPPRTANATATVIRRGDETAAARLREHGWLVVPPEAQTCPGTATCPCACHTEE